MPVSSGWIYTDKSVDPQLGVCVEDVQRVLGTSLEYLNELCTHKNVKTWARYKPQKINNPLNYVRAINEDQRRQTNYGIANIPTWTSLLNMMAFWTGTDASQAKSPSCGIRDAYWTWDPPTGGAYPYRLTDFEDYYAYAEPPVGGVKVVSGDASNIVTIVFNMGVSGVTAGLTVTLKDLADLNVLPMSYSQLYFGVGIKAGSSYYYATQNNQVGTMDGSGWNLWSMGAHARFKIDRNSGALYDCITNTPNPIPFQVFPILSSVPNYLEANNYANCIRPINGDVTGELFIALNPVESVTLSMQYIEGTINFLTAWKTKTGIPAGDIGKYVYFSFSFTNSDATSAHDFEYDVYALKSDGSVINSSVNQAVNNLGAGATHQRLSGNLDIKSSYNTAVRFRLVVRCSELNVTLKRETSATVTIEDDMRAA